jgi:hypothetical protein
MDSPTAICSTAAMRPRTSKLIAKYASYRSDRAARSIALEYRVYFQALLETRAFISAGFDTGFPLFSLLTSR